MATDYDTFYLNYSCTDLENNQKNENIVLATKDANIDDAKKTELIEKVKKIITDAKKDPEQLLSTDFEIKQGSECKYYD